MDFITNREPFFDDAEKIIGLCMEKRFQCCIAAHTIPNLFYISRRHLTIEKRKEVLLEICRMFTVIGIDRNKLISALQDQDFSDFEDRLQVECANEFNSDYIVTRNVKHFANSTTLAIEPTDLIEKISNL